jgi:acyl carrier protein
MLRADQVERMTRSAPEQPKPMEIAENELWILSYYRASELAGALVMGRLAGHTDDDDLRVHLTEHCAEEANHAWLWTRTILDVGGTPRRVSETYQSRYYEAIGPPTTVIDVLALTQVFEKRVLRHFRDHLRRPGTHPAVARTLERMIAEEAGHIGWVKKRLDRWAIEAGEAEVAEALCRFAEVDREVYARLVEYRDRFGELVDPARLVKLVAGAGGERGAGDGDGPARSRATAEREVWSFLAESLRIRPQDLDPETPLGMLGLESLELLAIVSTIEDTFRVELSPAHTERLYTLEDLVRAVAELATEDGSRRSFTP